MTLSITPFYAAILGIMFVYLSLRVALFRRKEQISLGDANDPVLQTRVRVQGNFAEYAPFGLLLLLMVELQGGHILLVHAIGLMLLVGRIAHAWGLSQNPQSIPLRKNGMILTFLAIVVGALSNLALALF